MERKKELSLLKVISAKHRSNFAALLLVMVTTARYSGINSQAAINKQTIPRADPGPPFFVDQKFIFQETLKKY
jgi:hypothetical protein